MWGLFQKDFVAENWLIFNQIIDQREYISRGGENEMERHSVVWFNWIFNGKRTNKCFI